MTFHYKETKIEKRLLFVQFGMSLVLVCKSNSFLGLLRLHDLPILCTRCLIPIIILLCARNYRTYVRVQYQLYQRIGDSFSM